LTAPANPKTVGGTLVVKLAMAAARRLSIEPLNAYDLRPWKSWDS
jgi:hypothetical protein